LNLTETQYQLVSTFTAGTLSVMLAAAVYFLVMRETVDVKQRASILIAGMYTGIAAFHYWRILGAWQDGFVRTDEGTYQQIGGEIFHGYRYADWLITVPMLVAQLVMVLALDSAMTKRLIRRLGGAAAAMVLIGLPGELSDNNSIKLLFWAAGCVPFAYIVYVLYFGMTGSLRRQSDSVVRTVSNARILLVGSWMFYPLVYLIPLIGLDGARGMVLRQVGYSVADVVAKPLFGLFLLRVAQARHADLVEASATADAMLPKLAVPTAPGAGVPAAPGVPTAPTWPTVGAQASGHRVPMPPGSSMSNGS
jgi:bacteriorhodopsin